MSTFWLLHGDRAHLRANDLTGCVNLLRPDEGLRNICLHNDSLVGLELLKSSVVQGNQPVTLPLLDRYVRGDDLIATYGESPVDDLRLQIYWRRLNVYDEKVSAPGIELICSLQTTLLDSFPAVICSTSLPWGEAWQLATVESRHWKPLQPARISDIGAASEQGAFAFRLPQSQFTYAQLILPGDFSQASLKVANEDAAELEMRLCHERLEKGVIRRARVRGIFLPQNHDLEYVAEMFSSWIQEEPPLTT